MFREILVQFPEHTQYIRQRIKIPCIRKEAIVNGRIAFSASPKINHQLPIPSESPDRRRTLLELSSTQILSAKCLLIRVASVF